MIEEANKKQNLSF